VNGDFSHPRTARGGVLYMAGHSGGTSERERGKRIISLGVIIAAFTDAESKKCNCDPNNVKLHTCLFILYETAHHPRDEFIIIKGVVIASLVLFFCLRIE
jgi:hypothetical protein